MSLVLPTYVSRHGYDKFFSARHYPRNRYFATTLDPRCRDILAPFWVNEDISDMSRHVFRHYQLRAKASSGKDHKDLPAAGPQRPPVEAPSDAPIPAARWARLAASRACKLGNTTDLLDNTIRTVRLRHDVGFPAAACRALLHRGVTEIRLVTALWRIVPRLAQERRHHRGLGTVVSLDLKEVS